MPGSSGGILTRVDAPSIASTGVETNRGFGAGLPRFSMPLEHHRLSLYPGRVRKKFPHPALSGRGAGVRVLIVGGRRGRGGSNARAVAARLGPEPLARLGVASC